MTETWKPVVGFDGAYEVSDQGQVRSVARLLPFTAKNGTRHVRHTKSRLLAQNSVNSGYLVVHLYQRNRRIARTVHSLMAAAFLGQRPDGYDVAHNNGRRTDNRVSNLRYATRSENLLDMRKHGTGNYPRGR